MSKKTYDEDKRKLLSALSHGSILFSAAFLIPIGLLFLSDDSVVKKNAKEALNFHINLGIYGVIFGILPAILPLFRIGFILMGILVLVSLIMPILAIVQVLKNPATTYRYPFIFRLV